MNTYEITFIVRPDLDDDSIDAVVDQVLGRIQTGKGEIIATLPWTPARRRMAYPIRDYGDGIYITITFRIDAQSIREMENALKLNDRILRFLIVQASELAVKQAQQRLQQRTAAAAAPPPVPAPISATVAGADAPPVEIGPATEVLAAQAGSEENAIPSAESPPASDAQTEAIVLGETDAPTDVHAETVRRSETVASPATPAPEPEPVAATPAAPAEPTEE